MLVFELKTICLNSSASPSYEVCVLPGGTVEKLCPSSPEWKMEIFHPRIKRQENAAAGGTTWKACLCLSDAGDSSGKHFLSVLNLLVMML